MMRYVCPSPCVCLCHYRCTCVACDLRVMWMSDQHVGLTCRIDANHHLVKEEFKGVSLRPSRCAHDLTDRFQLKITQEQWTLAVQDATSVICFQAFVFSLDVSLEGGGIMPTPENRVEKDDDDLCVLELFCGGFSGWSHVTRGLKEMQFPIVTGVALDIEHACVDAYHRTFGGTLIGPSLRITLDDDGKLPSLKVIECDLMEFGWVLLAGNMQYPIGVSSPPCPPWSKAALNPPGLRRKDGNLTPASIAVMALFGCRVLCLENVAGLTQHPHWGVIRDWLAFWNYDLRWQNCLDLSQVAPQKRERLILVATKAGDEKLMSHICQTWPSTGLPSLQQFDVLTQPTGRLLEESKPSDAVLRLYLDPSNLPKTAQSTRQNKRSKIDVERYRLRSPQDQMSCIMANYSVGHELPNHTVQQGGLYGALLALPSGLRFCTTPEAFLLQMPLSLTFIPHPRRTAIAIVGNSISAAHAAIALLNALAFITDSSPVEVVETFARLLDSRLKASSLTILEVEGGIVLTKSEIAPTLPLHTCELLVLKSPIDETRSHIQVGLNIHDVLKTLLGASIPTDLFLVPAEILDHKVPLHVNMLMQQEKTTLFASVQACFLMPTTMFGQVGVESKFVVALCTFGPVILARRRNLCIGDVIAFLNLEFEQRPFHCTDMLGLQFDSGDSCPDAFLVLSKPGIAPADFSCMLRLEVEIVGSLVSFGGFYHDLSNLLGLLRGTGILDMLMCVGWTCVIPITAWEDDRFNMVQIIRIPNQLAIEAIDVVHCIAIRLFISHLATLASVGSHPVIRVRIKFWSSWIWEGFWDPNSDFTLVHALWKDIMLKFGLTWDIRFIIHGHNVNFERPISQFVSTQSVSNGCVKIFLSTSLRGGGPRMLLLNSQLPPG